MRLIDLNTVLEEIEDTVTSVSFCGTVEAARSAHETKDCILSRVKDLKRAGYPITKVMETTRNRYGKKVSFAKYSLKKENDCEN